MAKIYKGATELIGNTPLVEVVNIEKQLGLEATVLAPIPLSRFPDMTCIQRRRCL